MENYPFLRQLQDGPYDPADMPWMSLVSLLIYCLICIAADFIAKTSDPDFDGAQALDMLQRSYTINYGSRRMGSTPAREDDTYFPRFRLDFISIIGQPLRSICRHSHFFDNITISLRHWQAPYSAKHVEGIPFDLVGRTFRLATGATREAWFVVMHPIQAPPPRPNGRRAGRAQRGSALVRHHAEVLASYIKAVFLHGELLGEGIEPSWVLGGQHSQMIAFSKWATFQELFMEGWPDFVEQQSHDTYWVDNQPAFHAYDYGANIEIKVNSVIQNLEQETRIQAYHQDAEYDSDDTDRENNGGREEVDEEGEDVMEASHYPEPDLSYEWSAPDSQHEPREAIDPMMSEMIGASPESIAAAPLADMSPTSEDQEGLYSTGLGQLREALEQKYNLNNISHVSYALAVDVHCTASDQSGAAVCLLADRNRVAMEFYGSNFTFHPLGFHPAFGNFTSNSPPAFLDHNLFTVMKDNMSHQNQGADVLSLGFFQGYSNLKRSFRHRADDLLASQGVATAALTIPATEASRGAYLRAKQQRLLRQLRGECTPENPGASTPFARERQRVEASMAEDEFAYRFEQVISIDAQRLVRERRNFGSVLQPIFQLIRLFLKEKQLYMGILRRFPPAVFPGVLTAFARTIELGIGEIDRRFRDSGSRGLGLALSEGVAALDRLGNYCFTGDPRVLPSRVLGPLGTMDSLRKCGWPYLCPRMLNLTKGRELIHLARWPKTDDNNRPILMHVASLAYHYGPTVAASRHSQLWFAELGGRDIDGLSGLTPFLEDVFRTLWVPETRAFISHQLRRGLSYSLRSGVLPDEKDSAHKATVTLTAWEECTSSFTWLYVAVLSHCSALGRLGS